ADNNHLQFQVWSTRDAISQGDEHPRGGDNRKS
ncbi:hypothetical protein CEXT_396251, partial [Caerostris extrusa]